MVAQIGNSRRCDCMNKALFDCVNKVLFDCANSSKRLTPLWHFAMIWLDSLLTFAGKVRRSKSTTRISHSVGPEEPWSRHKPPCSQIASRVGISSFLVRKAVWHCYEQ